MGQKHSCGFETSIARGISIKKEFTDEIKQKINPLIYINPLDPCNDEPEDLEEYSNPLKLVKQINSRQIIEVQIPQPSKKGKANIYLQSPEINEQVVKSAQPSFLETQIRKVAVSWDKFIKMKQKKFTDDYQVLKEVGRGGFGSVYKVMMKNSSGRIFRAAKKIMKQTLKKEEHQNLLQQMSIMMSLDHPNITKLFQVYDQSNCYIMILQLCEGGQLFQKIVEGVVNQKAAKNIIRQILSAINYMHAMGIVHRDIKPQNLLFEKKTKLIKIIDFGISSKVTKGQFLTTRVGTPYYIAPEVLQKKYSFSCDMWSLGIVLYMIIFNKPPFKGSDIVEVMQGVLNEEPSYKNFKFTNFSLLSLNFLKFLMQKNPQYRLSAQKALEHQWLNENKKITKKNAQKRQTALSRITHFHFKNKLQAVVHTYIVSQLLTSQERLDLLDLFRELDIDKNGVVDSKQLQQALQTKKMPAINETKLQKILDYVDTNCSGMIDYTEFLVAAIDFKKKFTQQHFEQAFEYFDIDKNGRITFQEVSQYLSGENQLNEEQIRHLFGLVDKNGDGVISKQQFVELLVNRQYRQL